MGRWATYSEEAKVFSLDLSLSQLSSLPKATLYRKQRLHAAGRTLFLRGVQSIERQTGNCWMDLFEYYGVIV